MTQARRTLIELAQRRQRPGTGSSPASLRERTARMDWPDLGAVLAGLPFAVIGAVATRLYMPEGATGDLDVLVAAEDAAAARGRLSAAGYRHVGELSVGGSTWRSPDEVAVDVLEGRAPWCPVALAEAGANRDAAGLPVLPLSYLVLMKLRAGRVQDVADVARMLGQADPPALDRVRARRPLGAGRPVRPGKPDRARPAGAPRGTAAIRGRAARVGPNPVAVSSSARPARRGA